MDAQSELTLTCGVQADAQALEVREAERSEAAAVLERRMAAMEAALAARRSPAQVGSLYAELHACLRLVS